MEVHFLADVLRNIGEVLLIILGKDHFVNTLPVRREQFLFHPADGKNAAPDGDLASHREVAAHGNIG